MAGASCQLNFLTQIQNARSELQTNFGRLLRNINDLQNQLVGEIQILEDEYHRQTESEEQLSSLTQQLCNSGDGKQVENRLTSIVNQIEQLFSERSSKLLVLEWDFATEQILLNRFCKISVNKQLSSSPQVNEENSLIDSMDKLNIAQSTWLVPEDVIAYTNSSSESEATTLSLEQKYKETRSPSFACCSKGSGNYGELNDPRGVGIDDNSDEIYVADCNSHCIVVFSNDGSYIREFTHNRMVNPVGIYVSGSFDRVFITVSGREAVHCYKLDGTFIKEIMCYGRCGITFDNPAGITMDSSERIYVCDRGNNRVPVFTRFLVFITVLTIQLSDPRDVKVVGSEVAILHGGDYCVSFYTRGGMFRRKVVKQGHNKQKVGHPSFFCIDSDSNILISDTDNDCIKVYRTTGFHICNLGSRGDCEGEFKEPAGMSFFDNGSLVTVCDRDDDQLQIFSL